MLFCGVVVLPKVWGAAVGCGTTTHYQRCGVLLWGVGVLLCGVVQLPEVCGATVGQLPEVWGAAAAAGGGWGKRQQTVAASTTEAEYMAASAAAREPQYCGGRSCPMT